MSLVRRLAASGPVPVFAAVGSNSRERVDDLSLAPGIKLVATPRHASVLLVAGDVRPEDEEALRRLHDQLPHPRATLWWDAQAIEGITPSVIVAAAEDPVPPLRKLYRHLLADPQASENDLLPDVPPAPWRGVGTHGQGGEGMMGGKPYGRPMAMTGDDLRDGLALDAYTVQLGPFLPILPAGLVLELTLQGDVIQHAEIIRPPLPAATIAQAPLTVADRERARAAHRLRCIARLLIILELRPQAERCRRAAQRIARGESVAAGDLGAALKHSGAFAAIPAGLGQLSSPVAQALGGVRRAAAPMADRHDGDRTHPALAAPATEPLASDVRGRLRQWLDEVKQSLTLIADTHSAGPGALPGDFHRALDESPAVDARPPLEFRFTELLPGLEWGEALLVIASFDATAIGRMSPAVHPPVGHA